MKKVGVITLLFYMVCTLVVHAQWEVRTEAQLTTSDGDNTPLWLNANKYGLSSLDKTNGYLRAGLFRPIPTDSTARWGFGGGADIAVATGFTSTMVVQQLYGDVRWLNGLLTIGAKEHTLELKNQELSSGSQTLGINARPVPGLRLSLPHYWNFAHGLFGVKGHIFYGWTTDDNWQTDFTHKRSKYTQNTMLHTKAGYLRIGKPEKPFNVELGLEMGCQFGGTTYSDPSMPGIKNEKGLKSIYHAFIPSGSEATEKAIDKDYMNEAGNHVGSWVLRANYDTKSWGVSLYADHFFEDQSGLFFLDYDGYGTDDKWDSWEHFRWMVYDLRDYLVGMEWRLKQFQWIDAVVAEFIYTKYQSGPVYHDHTKALSDHISGTDNYYNNAYYTGWQHWGQVMGNPLYRSPLYNDGKIKVLNNRFWGLHLGMSGNLLPTLRYRLLYSWQKGYGTYDEPFMDPQYNRSFMAEACYQFPCQSFLGGWQVKAAFGADHGKILGNNTGFQLTIGKNLILKNQ